MSKSILYSEIKKKLNEMSDFHFEGLYNGQFDRVVEGEEDPINYPAMFVKFDIIDWSDVVGVARKVQDGAVEVDILIGFKQLDKDNEETLSEVDKVFVQLHGLAHEAFQPLRRIRDTQDVNYQNVEVWVITFKTTLRDCQASDDGSILHVIENLEERRTSDLVIENVDIRSGRHVGP